ncbi:MAG: response regulator transcription factor [Myxococcales bacterium]|nr:response regulator transcription factor [Myxococcales bacterium]
MSGRSRTVFLVDDHPVVRMGLVHLIGAMPGWEVVGQAGSAEDAIDALPAGLDVLVTDLRMNGLDGLALTRLVKVSRPDLPVLVLSSFDEGLFAEQSLDAGASGFLMKDAEPELLREALECVAEGGVHLSDAMWSQLVPQVPARDASVDPELFEALAGVPTSDQGLAMRLGISAMELRTRRRAAMRALDLRPDLQLTLAAHLP